MYLRNVVNWVSGGYGYLAGMATPHLSRAGRFLKHADEKEGPYWLTGDILVTTSLGLMAIRCAAESRKQADKKEFKKACVWTLLMVASSAAAVLNAYNTWSTIYASALQCREAGQYQKNTATEPGVGSPALTCTKFNNAFGEACPERCAPVT